MIVKAYSIRLGRDVEFVVMNNLTVNRIRLRNETDEPAPLTIAEEIARDKRRAAGVTAMVMNH